MHTNMWEFDVYLELFHEGTHLILIAPTKNFFAAPYPKKLFFYVFGKFLLGKLICLERLKICSWNFVDELNKDSNRSPVMLSASQREKIEFFLRFLIFNFSGSQQFSRPLRFRERGIPISDWEYNLCRYFITLSGKMEKNESLIGFYSAPCDEAKFTNHWT